VPISESTTYIPAENVAWDYEGQVVLVTGAAHGQGASHATAFAEAGANVVISDIAGEMQHVEYSLGTVDELESVAARIRDLGSRCLSSVCDVRRSDQVQSLVARAIAEFGRIDVLVSNAGIGTVAAIFDMPESQWTETLETNLRGAFFFCKYVAPHMIAAGSGRIVVTGSTQSVGSLNGIAHYTAAKHGLLGLVKAFAQELEPHGVTINLICPTAVDTAMNETFTAERYQAWSAEAGALVGAWNLFQEDMIHEREITEGVLWLASRQAASITGTTLMIDAGCMCK
jgi:NAD(P)-dependent dehydrogenase (short-subunit alcohol dehydrogenase family)